jgi:toxin-antitoxin system PIN domain toxin
VLIALMVPSHVHHRAADAWLAAASERFATCPVTQGSLVRFLIREGMSGATALRALAEVEVNPRHEFWPDDISYRDVPLTGVIGHRQVTDAYLVQLARRNGGKIATFDKGLAALHADAVVVVPILTPQAP